MKLRNKKTGEIKSIEEIIRDAFLSNELDSLKSIDTNWEDVDVTNATNIPIIKDEKIRKAVRAWAEANAIVYINRYDSESFVDADGSTCIDFDVDESIFNDVPFGRNLTIDELCGEEKG